MRKPGFETLCAHAGEDPRRHLGAVVPPIYQNSIFSAEEVGTPVAPGERDPEPYHYTRVANPTTDVVETKLAALERAQAARAAPG